MKRKALLLGAALVAAVAVGQVKSNRVGSIAVSRSGGGSSAFACDAGYAAVADGGCVLPGRTCTPDLGIAADGGCVLPTWPSATPFCSAMQSGDKAGNWWCLKGDGTMESGSIIGLYPVNAPDTISWPVLPGPATETMTVLNDFNLTASWTQYFTTDGGQYSPPGSFSTCWIHSNGMRTSTLNNYTGGGVRYGNAVQKWFHSARATGTEGDSVTQCKFGASNDCNGAQNNQITQQRAFGLHCAIFTSGDGGASSGSTNVCTAVQGVAAATCVSTAHSRPRIQDGGVDFWYVGMGTSGPGNSDMMNGLFRGALMTEKALSQADVERIGAATLPGALAGSSFARSTNRTCCNSAYQCVVLPPNVPCSSGTNEYSLEGAMVNRNDRLEDVTVLPFTVSAGATRTTPSLCRSPFGMKTLALFEFAATAAPGGRAYAQVGTGFGGTLFPPAITNGSFFCLTTDGGTESIDWAEQSSPVNYFGPVTCGPTLVRHNLTTNSGSAGLFQFGNLGSSTTYTGTPVSRAARSVCAGIGMTEISPAANNTPSSYIQLLPSASTTTNTRAAETCSGVGCP